MNLKDQLDVAKLLGISFRIEGVWIEGDYKEIATLSL